MVILAALVIRRKSELWQDQWPYRLFVLGIGTRVCIIGLKYVLNAITGTGLAIFGDSAMHLHQAEVVDRVLAGMLFLHQRATVPLIYGDYGYSITHWFYGSIYRLFGWSQFLLLIINALAGCLAALLIYLITLRICKHKPSASLAMGLTLFFPSLIMWSVELLKEPIIQLYTALLIYWFICTAEKRKWQYLLPLAVLCYPLGHLRKFTHLLMFAVLGLSSVLVIPKRIRTSALILLVLTAAVAIKLGPSGISVQWQSAQDKIIGSQIGFITTGGSWYKFIPQRFTVKNRSPRMTPVECTISYAKAVGYYLMTPFPFKVTSFNKLPALPQMIIWYFLVIFCLLPGSLYLLRYHFRSSVILMVYLAVFTSAQALFTGNEGTAFRQRDVLTIFYFIPMSIGFFNLRGWLSLRLESMRHRAFPQTEDSD
ncbi:MAG: hypothetical protein HOC71_18170 [Candidatus Latescibacteria bacterium]|nr:hypothetical protein [Candidatus Latescibacterota bacterium]